MFVGIEHYNDDKLFTSCVHKSLSSIFVGSFILLTSQSQAY